VSISNIAMSEMFNLGAPQFTPETKYIRNTRTDITAFMVLEVWYLISVFCAAAIIFRNKFATMKIDMHTIHGTKSVAWSFKERKYGRCC